MSNKRSILVEKIIMAILAYVFAWGLTEPYVFQAEGCIKANSVTALMVFLAAFLAFSWVFRHSTKRTRIVSILPAVILGTCYRVGTEFYATGHLNLKNISLYTGIAVTALVFWLTLTFIYTKLETLSLRFEISGKSGFWKFYERHQLLCYFILIIICWIPAFLAVFPGIYSYDAYPQVLQIIGGQGLSAHHPLLHTWLLNGCFIFGKWLTNDYNMGLMLYTLIQMAFMAAVFAYVLKRMRSYRIPAAVRVFSFLFLAVNPIVQIWVCLTTKDTIFAGFFLLVMVETVGLITDSRNFFRSKLNVIRFIAWCILMCLFRNQGIYILYLMGIVLVLCLRGFRKKCLLTFLSAAVAVNIFTGPISNGLGVEPANPREALSVPIQQIARVLTQDPDHVTQEEKDTVYEYIPEEYVNQYLNVTSDTVKEGFNAEQFREDPLPFFKVWLSIGIKNISAYVDAFLYLSCGYFYTDYTPYWVEFILYDGAWLDNGQNILNISRNSLFPAYDEYLRGVSEQLTHEKIPVLSVILNEAFPFLVLVFVGSGLLIRRKYKLMLPLLMVFAFWGTMLLGPVLAIRYAFPIIVCVPMMMSMLFMQGGGQEPDAVKPDVKA